MNLLRSILFNIFFLASGTLISLWGLVVNYFAPARVIAVARFWARSNLRALRVICGVKLRLEGEVLPTGGVIIAAQHQSALDILAWMGLLEEPAFVLKQELLKIPFFGALLLPAGMIAVDRNGGAGAMKKMITECRKKLAQGRPIVIFPEGTRVAPGARAALQPGIVGLARALNVPVVPAATNSGLRWGRKAFLKTPGVVTVRVFAPLPPGLDRAAMMAALAGRFYDDGVG